MGGAAVRLPWGGLRVFFRREAPGQFESQTV